MRDAVYRYIQHVAASQQWTQDDVVGVGKLIRINYHDMMQNLWKFM